MLSRIQEQVRGLQRRHALVIKKALSICNPRYEDMQELILVRTNMQT